MDQQKWLLVKANFEGTEDLADGYYRLREIEDGYQLAYLVAGPCGDKNPHPEITLLQEGNQVRPIRLRDVETTPILNLSEKEDSNMVEELTDQLLNRFIKIKKLSL
ncbi:hypothetical protein KQI58_02030 [Enterococcus raffinosus]|uniref:hypothetical protein n=1 Tax=Enterococcus raffinosus TaxID=71452 RepID=UPI001C10260E|nr:hypothetical protein [Enterococcus raffinosus]MBU5359854.1 hypothetical protein [Enterococcus raffinosus]